jgi:citrate lyase synthetase
MPAFITRILDRLTKLRKRKYEEQLKIDLPKGCELSSIIMKVNDILLGNHCYAVFSAGANPFVLKVFYELHYGDTYVLTGLIKDGIFNKRFEIKGTL